MEGGYKTGSHIQKLIVLFTVPPIHLHGGVSNQERLVVFLEMVKNSDLCCYLRYVFRALINVC